MSKKNKEKCRKNTQNPHYKKLKSEKAINHEPDWKKASRASSVENDKQTILRDRPIPVAKVPRSEEQEPTSSVAAQLGLRRRVNDINETM